MTKDYAKPSTSRKPPANKRKKKAPTGASRASAKAEQGQSRFKFVILLILLLGGFGYALYSLQTVPAKKQTPVEQLNEAPHSNTKNDSAAPPTQQSEQAEAKPETRFKFYELLPNTEVDTGNIDAYKFKEKGAGESYDYIIQTGSFRSARDAERQKATIAFQGIKANIKPVKNSSGTTWYRVETDTYRSRSAMNSALDKLVAINIEPLVKKIKRDKKQ